MPLVTGNLNVPNRAAELLVAVLHHPQDVMREAWAIENVKAPAGQMAGEEWEEWEEWDVLTAVAASLRKSSTRGDQCKLDAEIHLLRHLAARHH